jgi:hypothetical protein
MYYHDHADLLKEIAGMANDDTGDGAEEAGSSKVLSSTEHASEDRLAVPVKGASEQVEVELSDEELRAILREACNWSSQPLRPWWRVEPPLHHPAYAEGVIAERKRQRAANLPLQAESQRATELVIADLREISSELASALAFYTFHDRRHGGSQIDAKDLLDRARNAGLLP